MTDYTLLKKFIRSFRSYSIDDAKTENDLVDPRILDRSHEEIVLIRDELAAYLASGPTDYELSDFWNNNNQSIHLGNLRNYRLFFNIMLERFKFYAT